MNASIINAAQTLMKQKFSNTAGLTDTALVTSGKTDINKTSNLVKILHQSLIGLLSPTDSVTKEWYASMTGFLALC